jgi:dipeptide/tripeptide permease
VKLSLQWVAAVIAAVVILIIGVAIASIWTGLGDSDISAAGWLAMGLGVIVTLALGIGLMALVFISNRRGYDEIGRGDT